MSEMTGPAPLSALNQASFEGYVTVTEQPVRSMITLRGDLPALAPAVLAATGLAVPAQRGISLGEGYGVLWMSPDELLVIGPFADHTRTLSTLQDKVAAGGHLSAVDVSQARASFAVTGEDVLVREAIAKLAPVDMAPGAFGPGMVRRTRLAQVPAAFWMPDAGRAELICFRSVADYVFTILTDAARKGSEVNLFSAQ